MALTLNQVIDRFQTYSNNHHMVNSFYYGDVLDFLTNGDVNYTACFLELLGTDISRVNKNTTFKFRLWFADLENVSISSQENNQDIESDLTQIAQDYISLMQYDTDRNTDFQASTSATLQYYREKFNDVVIAVSLDVNVSTRYASSACQVPTEIALDNTAFIYYGYKLGAEVLTQSQILASSRVVINKGSDYDINFGGAGEPSYLWVAQPSSEPIKMKWQDTINQLNGGNIGGSEDLFGAHSNIGQFDFIQTNYKTEQNTPIKFLQ